MSLLTFCDGRLLRPIFFKEPPHPCFLVNTATLQFVTATVFSVNPKTAGTLGAYRDAVWTSWLFGRADFFSFSFFFKKHCVGNLTSGCRLVGPAAAAWMEVPVSSRLQPGSMRLAFLCHLNERELRGVAFPQLRWFGSDHLIPAVARLFSADDEATRV